MRFAAAGFLLLHLTVSSTLAMLTCPEPFLLLGDNCYYISTENMSWQESRDYCKSLSLDYTVDLAVFDLTCEDYRHVFTHMTLSGIEPRHWIGGTQLGLDGYWIWIDSRPMDFSATYWKEDQPYPGFKCVQLFNERGFERLCLISNKCSYSRSFICQLNVHGRR